MTIAVIQVCVCVAGGFCLPEVGIILPNQIYALIAVTSGISASFLITYPRHSISLRVPSRARTYRKIRHTHERQHHRESQCDCQQFFHCVFPPNKKVRSRSRAPKNAPLRLRHTILHFLYRNAEKEPAFLPKDKNTSLYKKSYRIVWHVQCITRQAKMQVFVKLTYFVISTPSRTRRQVF